MIRLMLGVVVLGVLAGCETGPKQVLPYVQTDASGGVDVYLYDVQAGLSMPITRTPEVHEFDPAVDYAGARVAYIDRQDEDGLGTVYRLYIHDLQTGERDVLRELSGRLASPAWSNNGESLAYVVERDGKLQIEVREVFGGKGARVIGFGSEPSWRVDDGAVFYSSRDTVDAPSGDLMVYDLKTGINQSLKLRGNGFANLARGTSIVYTSTPYSRRNEAIWIIDATSRQNRLSSPGKDYRDTDPVHINGSKFVAFTRTDVKTGKSSIYVVERYAQDPVETLLFEADADVSTKGK